MSYSQFSFIANHHDRLDVDIYAPLDWIIITFDHS